MSPARYTVPFVKSIFHPSDFSKASELAFAHALAIALFRKTQLVIMHAGGVRVGDWAQFPPVRKTLENWQVLAPGSPRSAVYEKLSISVKKVSAKGNPVEASIRQIERQKPDLVVLATRGRHGLPLWLKPSIAQGIARRSSAMTLFVPRGCRGIVSIDGVIQLRRILLPIDHQPDAQEAVVRAVRAAEAFGDEGVEIVILHVNGENLPQYARPETQVCSWKELRRKGEVATTILEVANNRDLIVMATEGRHGMIDAMRGSVTERVVRGASCPVLAVPAA
ncbi:MAG TPA: universal stress protein [Candidatus Binatia bacterium]|nr:universal stress protein [Candidatus Binatia bacterium]